MRGAKITIGTAEIDIFLSTKAMLEISELMDGKPFVEITEWLTSKDIPVEKQFERMCLVVGTLANGAIFKHNADIRLGLKTGDIKEPYNIKDFCDVLDPFDTDSYFSAIVRCINNDNSISIPANIKTTEEDEVLKELEEEKNL